MLYVTTRNNRDAFTAQRALRENRGPDGGLYLPFHVPKFSSEKINALAEKSFGQNVADILNLLFQTKLTNWDVDFCIGRYPVRIESLRHRILIAETWHNPQWKFDWVTANLTNHLCDAYEIPGDWVKIAVRIAILFGVFGELKRLDIHNADISVVSGDFSLPISAWYAREWGLPIGNIICCCNENNGLWDLICHGQFRTDTVSMPTITPEADVALPEDLERLICGCGGTQEVEHYLEVCRRGGMYCPDDAVLARMRKGMFVSVVSSKRLETTIPSVYSTHGYVLSPSSALPYAGLLDYRAKTGETGYALVIADKSPVCDIPITARCLGVPEETLRKGL